MQGVKTGVERQMEEQNCTLCATGRQYWLKHITRSNNEDVANCSNIKEAVIWTWTFGGVGEGVFACQSGNTTAARCVSIWATMAFYTQHANETVAVNKETTAVRSCVYRQGGIGSPQAY